LIATGVVCCSTTANDLPRPAIVRTRLRGGNKEAAMSQTHEPILDEDLTPHFHWRWGEHGIYLAVCSVLGLAVLALYTLPIRSKRPFDPHAVELIQVRYLTAADEPPEKNDPFHDPRLIRLPRKHVQERSLRRAM
jgi:hypothetical protein